MSIWKLQRPLASLGLTGYPEILAYTEGQEHTALIPVPEDGWVMVDRLFGDEPKVYAKAHIANGMLVIDQVVEDQAW